MASPDSRHRRPRHSSGSRRALLDIEPIEVGETNSLMNLAVAPRGVLTIVAIVLIAISTAKAQQPDTPVGGPELLGERPASSAEVAEMAAEISRRITPFLLADARGWI